MMIAPVVSKIFLWKYIWRHLYTYFCSILIQNSDYTLMAPLIVMCSPQAELHLPPNICGCAASTEPSHRGSWCPLSYPETTVYFVANVSIMFRYKIQIFFFCQSSETGLAYSACLMVGMDCVHVSKGKVYLRLLYRRSSTSQPTLTEKSL